MELPLVNPSILFSALTWNLRGNAGGFIAVRKRPSKEPGKPWLLLGKTRQIRVNWSEQGKCGKDELLTDHTARKLSEGFRELVARTSSSA